MSDVKTQADVTDVRPLDLEAARIAVNPIVDAELQAEWPVGCLRCTELQRDLTALQSRCEAAERDVKRWRDTADESAKNVTFLRDKEQQAQRQAERECNDIDDLLEQLGLNVEQCRTDGGWLNVPKIVSKLRDDPPWTRPQDTAIKEAGHE